MCHRIVAFTGSIPQGYSAILSLVLSDKYIKFAFSKVSYITYQYVPSLIENYTISYFWQNDDDNEEDDLCRGATLHKQFGNFKISSMGRTVQSSPALL